MRDCQCKGNLGGVRALRSDVKGLGRECKLAACLQAETRRVTAETNTHKQTHLTDANFAAAKATCVN